MQRPMMNAARHAQFADKIFPVWVGSGFRRRRGVPDVACDFRCIVHDVKQRNHYTMIVASVSELLFA